MKEDIYKTIHQLSCFVGHPVDDRVYIFQNHFDNLKI